LWGYSKVVLLGRVLVRGTVHLERLLHDSLGAKVCVAAAAVLGAEWLRMTYFVLRGEIVLWGTRRSCIEMERAEILEGTYAGFIGAV